MFKTRSKRHLRYIHLARLLWHIPLWYTWVGHHERIVVDWTRAENFRTQVEIDEPRTIIMRRMQRYLKAEALMAERLLEQLQGKRSIAEAQGELPSLTVRLRMIRDTLDHMHHAVRELDCLTE